MDYQYYILKAVLLFFSTIIILTAVIPVTSAQVHIAPVALYLSDNDKTGRIVVHNSSNQPQELNIDLIFGYPATNEDGEVYMKKFESVPEGEPSAAEWIRVYPRHLILPAHEQQTIRFSARPPSNLQAGEYWARPAITVRDTKENKTSVSEQISANINMIKRTVLSINYRHGNVSTGIAVPKMEISAEDGLLNILAELERKGNAAYLGHAFVRIYDLSGNVVVQNRKEIAVYHRQNRSFEVDTDNLPAGKYRVELTLRTENRARENESIINAPPVSKVIETTIK